MNLRALAESDLAFIMESDGDTIKVTDPSGKSDSFIGLTSDISQLIDPDTGAAVSGRRASVSLRISSLYSKGFTLPEGVADTRGKPWVVEFNDVNGRSYKFKVAQSNPDRAAGVVTCLLELYK